MQYILLADRWLLAVLFLITGLAKVKHIKAFSEAVDRYGIVPRLLVAPLAATLPFVELGLGLMLAAGAWLLVAGSLAAVLFAGFGGAIGWNVAQGRRFDCGCGVGGGAPLSWGLVLRNFVLIILATTIAVGPSSALALWPGSAVPAHSPAATALLPIPLIVVLGCLLVRLAIDFQPVDWLPRWASSRENWPDSTRPHRSLGQ